ncbi:MAG: type II secretion system protein [candidate division WOR-3 bacterium]
MKKRGFTLIELMVVVVIIGILAAIAIPNFVRVVDRSREASVKSNMHTLQVAVEALAVDHDGNYPGTANTDDIEDELPLNYKNPYTGATLEDDGLNACISVGAQAGSPGMVGYEPEDANQAQATDFNGVYYEITGYGKNRLIDLTLRPGTNLPQGGGGGQP